MTPFAIAGVQMHVAALHSNVDAMLHRLDVLMARFPWTQMVVFSELAPYGPLDKFAQPFPNDTLASFQEAARRYGVWLLPGSMFEKRADGRIFNTAVVINPEGEIIARYSKMFPFRPYEAGIAAGSEFCVFDVPDVGRFGVSICYDIWFPETTRHLTSQGVEVLLNPVLTGTTDRDAELAIARATAAQFQCYVFAINGLAAGGVGRSIVVDPSAMVLHQSQGQEDLFPVEVDLDLVRRQLHRDYDSDDLQNAGLRIFTTLDPVAQHAVQKSLDERLQRLEQQYSNTAELQGAVILASVDTGEIIALTGQRDGSFGFNRALDARRPIGSLVKPAVYLTALARPEQYSVITPIADMPVSLPQPDGTSWVPENYDREFHGEVPLYQALAQSYNLATVNLGLELGVARVADTLEAMLPGLSLLHYPSLLLGSVDLTPLQVTQMYQTIAAGGFRTPLKSIVAVLDSDGEPLRRYPLSVEQVAPTRASYLTTFLLAQVVERGTARSAAARLPNLMPLAGKTGTTDELRDSWFAGFGSDRIGVVWVGRDDNQPTELTGASGALQVWTDIMAAVKPRPLTLTPPDGVRWQKVINGKRTDEDCERASSFPFIVPHLPEEYEPCHGSNAVERLFRRIF